MRHVQLLCLNPVTLADWLIAKLPAAKRTTLRRMVADGRVSVNGVVATRFNAAVGPGDRIEVADKLPRAAAETPMPAATITPATAGAYQVIFEDDDLLVVHKPAGLLTSTVPREPRPTLLAMVQADQRRRNPRARVGLVHRLDRDASGLLVFSKTDAAYTSLKTQFFHHTVQRVYHAVVRGTPSPPAGRIQTRLVERADGVVYSTRQAGRGEVAITDYALVRTVRRLSLVRVTLETGRKHQIRVHLAGRNWSILGDSVYGHGEKSPPETGLMLAATRLGFKHPRSGERVSFEIPLPAEMLAHVPA